MDRASADARPFLAWHILKKDARALRTELILLGGFAVFVAWSFTHLEDPSWAAVIAAVGANYIIARLIHLDPVAGESPFWITRPYPPRSMLFAKLLFLVLFIQLPMLVVDVYVIATQGFFVAESLPGLITFQILMFVCGVIPVACMASLTSGLVEFLFAELAALCLMFLLGFGLTYLGSQTWIPVVQAGPPAVDWFRSSLAAAVIAGVAVTVFFRQYTGKATEQNRLVATGGVLTASALYIFLPWTAELNLQTLISPNGVAGTKIAGTLETVAKSVFPIRGRKRVALNEVNLPITLHGIGPDDRLVVDALYIRLIGRAGREWSQGLIPVTVRPAAPGQALMNAEILIPQEFFTEEAAHPISLRARLYLTLFGKPRSATIPIRRPPVRVMDGLQCSEGSLIEFTCRSTFRWPQRLVSVESANSMDSVNSLSYSPLPADLGSLPIETRPLPLAWTATDITISSRAPVAHVRSEITVPDIVLANFTVVAKIRHDRGIGMDVLK